MIKKQVQMPHSSYDYALYCSQPCTVITFLQGAKDTHRHYH